MFRLPIEVRFALLFMTTVALAPTAKVIILALTAHPATVGERKLLSTCCCLCLCLLHGHSICSELIHCNVLSGTDCICATNFKFVLFDLLVFWNWLLLSEFLLGACHLLFNNWSSFWISLLCRRNKCDLIDWWSVPLLVVSIIGLNRDLLQL